MTIYSFVDDGKDPTLASKPYQGHTIKFVTGEGSIHFPHKDEGEKPYISYENNRDVKYTDGEVVKGKFYFSNIKYDPLIRHFKGTIQFDRELKDINPFVTSIGSKFEYELRFNNDFTAIVHNYSTVKYKYKQRQKLNSLD